MLHKLACDLELPKLTFQVIATLAQKKGTIKDVQGVMRYSRTATTTDVYMQEIPESVQATANSINPELRKSSGKNHRKRVKPLRRLRLVGREEARRCLGEGGLGI